MKTKKNTTPLRTAFIYAVFSAIWILLSDEVASFLFPTTSPYHIWAQTIKGWFFVLASAILIYLFIRSGMKSLQKSEEHFRGLFENSGASILIIDKDGKYTRANRNAAAAANILPQELVGKSISDFLPKEAAEKYLKLHKELLKTGGRREYEDTFETPAGRRSFLVVDQCLKDENGVGYAVQSISVDITERKKMEATLSESEERYHRVSDLISDYAYSFRITAEGKTVYEWVTDGFARINGYTIDEVAERGGTHTLVHPDDLEIALQHIQSLLKNQASTREFRIISKDGKIHWLQNYASPVWDEGEQRVVRIYGSTQDITERKQTEEALKKSEQKWISLVQTITDYIALFDKNGRYVFLNHYAEGYSEKDLLGKHYTDFLAKETEAAYVQGFETAQRSGLTQYVEYKAPGDNGLTRQYDSYMTPIFENGKFANMLVLARDITESKQAKDALQESEEKFRSLIEQSSDGIVLVDEDGKIIEWNSAETQIDGIPRERALGSPFWEIQYQLLPPEKREKFSAEDFKQAFFDPFIHGNIGRLGKLQDFEIVTANGERKFVQQTSFLIKTDKGNRIGAIIRDVTAHLQTEKALKASEARSRAIINAVPDLLFEINRDGTILGYSASDDSDLYISPETFLGKNLKEIMPLHITQEAMQKIEEALASRNVTKFDYDLPMSDGPRFYEDRIAPLSEDTVLSVIRDITERVRSEIELRESEEKYRSLAENIESGVVTVDAQGAFHYLNSVAAAELGGKPPAFIGKTVYEIFPPAMADTQMQIIHHVMETGTGTVTETKAYLTGRETWYRTSIEPIRDVSGRVKLALVHMVDITERRAMEEKLRATVEEKESLLREVHHRVKNNMQAIIALMDMQSEQIKDHDSRQFLKELEGQARTMSLVYEQLYQSENLAHVAMGPYIHKLTSNILEAFGKTSSLKLELNTPATLDVAEATPCGLIINELFTNILKYAFPPQFKERPTVRIELIREGQTCRLTVSDNGVGLPPDLDIHSTRTLGLHLVNLWATHQLGGTLKINRTAGTIFSIIFTTQRQS